MTKLERTWKGKDKLHPYIVVLTPPANWFPPNLPPTQFFLQPKTVYGCMPTLWIIWLLEDDTKQKGSISVWVSSYRGKLCPRAMVSPWLGASEEVPLRCPSLWLDVCTEELSAQGLSGGSCPLSCEPCQGQQMSRCPLGQPPAWCWPRYVLKAFHSHLWLPLSGGSISYWQRCSF